jgi:hypothetical protein
VVTRRTPNISSKMTTKKYQNTGSWTSISIGAPVGLVSMYFGLLMPAALFGEGFVLAMAAPLLVYPSLSLIVSFLLILWFAGRFAADNLAKGQNVFLVSIKYSVTVNFVIWTAFYLVLIFVTQGVGAENFLLPPIVFMLIGIISAPFTIGLFICFMIKRKITTTNSDIENLSVDDESESDSEIEIDNSQLLIKRHTYECDLGKLVIEQKLNIPSSDDVAYLNDKLAPTGKYKIGEKQFVFVSNGNIYAIRGFADK